MLITMFLNLHFQNAPRTPLFCLDCSDDIFSSIQLRLHKKGIISECGMIGDYFDEQRFFRDPMIRKLPRQEIEREFHIRLIKYEAYLDILSRKKGDDLFIISHQDYKGLDVLDVCVEFLDVNKLEEVSYLIGVCHDCE